MSTVSHTQLQDASLKELLKRVIDVARPERIILFGSRARDEAGPSSDYDLLIIRSDVHRRQLAKEIYRNLIGLGVSVDIIVAAPEDIERFHDAKGLIFDRVLSEGITVYECEAVAT